MIKLATVSASIKSSVGVRLQDSLQQGLLNPGTDHGERHRKALTAKHNPYQIDRDEVEELICCWAPKIFEDIAVWEISLVVDGTRKSRLCKSIYASTLCKYSAIATPPIGNCR